MCFSTVFVVFIMCQILRNTDTDEKAVCPRPKQIGYRQSLDTPRHVLQAYMSKFFIIYYFFFLEIDTLWITETRIKYISTTCGLIVKKKNVHLYLSISL